MSYVRFELGTADGCALGIEDGLELGCSCREDITLDLEDGEVGAALMASA